MKAILFDLDCTLVDRRRSIGRYAGFFYEHFQSRLTDGSPSAVTEVLIAADGSGYRATGRAGDIVGGLGWNDAPTAQEVEDHWQEVFPGCSVLMSGAVEVLAELRVSGFALGIVTNGGIQSQTRKVEDLQLDELVDTVIISAAIRCSKPDPGIFAEALSQLDVEASSAVFVGDHPENDVLGAESAGLTPIWLSGTHPWPTDHPLPKYRTDTLDQVPSLVSQIMDS